MVYSDRYHRQRLVKGIGDCGQEKISQATIAIVGVGALGCMSASLLARAGVGKLVLIDRDIVETTNLQRQILFTEKDANNQKPKAIAAKAHLENANSEITITHHVENLTARNIERLLKNVDVIVDGLDNFHTRYLLNDYAVKTETPYMFAGVIAGRGNVMSIMTPSTPCLRCLFPNQLKGGNQDTCDSAGILGPAIGIAASCQTMDTIKYISGNKDRISPTLLTFDLWNTESSRLSTGKPLESCPCCNKKHFEFLQKIEPEPLVLCGQNAVQLPSNSDFDLQLIAARLDEHGSFDCNDSMIKGYFHEECDENNDAIRMLCFKDGRTIIHGTNDINRAKAIFERYVGT